MKNFLPYFQKNFAVKQLGDITWSHAVNSQEKLHRFLNNPKIMMIESDIRINPDGVAVAAHPPDNTSDLTFEELITQMKTSKQGLKLDFKDPEILEQCLRYLQSADLNQPVLINADILQGNGANPSKFSTSGFMALSKKYYAEGILSIGWTTTADPDKPYTKENVDAMLNLCKDTGEVTFPVRACLLPNSWQELQRLLEHANYSLSIWNNEPVDNTVRDWIKTNTDPTKTMYDFIDDNKDPLKLW